MWRQLSIQNFRSIEQADITFSRFNVLVGRNSVGKSNVADALAFFSEMTSQPDLAIARRGGVSRVFRWRPGRPADMRMSLCVAETKEALDDPRGSPGGGQWGGSRTCHAFHLSSRRAPRWEIEKQSVSIRRADMELGIELRGGSLTRGELDFPMPELEPTASMIPYLRGLRRYAPALRPLGAMRRYKLSPRAMTTPREVSDNVLLEEDGGNIAMAVDHLRKASASGSQDLRWPAVLVGMQRIIPGLADIRVEPVDRFRRLLFLQVLESSSPAPFSAAEISDGALRALGILVAAAQIEEDELLIVEEPESHLHPEAAGLVFDQLKDASERGAVLLTTHSPELLDAAVDESILVCQYENGRTLVGPLAESQLSLVREGLFTVAELIRSEDLRIEGREVETLTPARAAS